MTNRIMPASYHKYLTRYYIQLLKIILFLFLYYNVLFEDNHTGISITTYYTFHV